MAVSHFNVFISTDNAAFEEGGVLEVRSIVAVAVEQFNRGATGGILRDTNGNRVGLWGYTGDDGKAVRFSDDENAAVVVYGDPVDGLQFVGPFSAHWEAQHFAEHADWDDGQSWWVAELSSGL